MKNFKVQFLSFNVVPFHIFILLPFHILTSKVLFDPNWIWNFGMLDEVSNFVLFFLRIL